MLPRLPIFPPYPPPWDGRAARDLKTARLILNSSEGTEWNRVQVSMPTLVMPYRDDDSTGAFANPGGGGQLKWLSLLYSPEQPQRDPPHAEQVRALSSVRGACYLWAPGEWWIKAQCGSAGGVGFGVNGQGTAWLPVELIPVPDPRFLDALFFGRSSRREPVSTQFTFAAGASGCVLTVQDQLDGLRALDVSITQSATWDMRWTAAPAASSRFQMQIGQWPFEGPNLPLADLWLLNNAAANRNMHTNRYF